MNCCDGHAVRRSRTEWSLGLIVVTTVLVVECTCVLFSVAYHAGEDIGNVPSGLIVLAVLATPVVMGVLRRLLAPPILMSAGLALLAAGRVALQSVSSVGFVLAGGCTAVGLLSLGLVLVAARRHAHRAAQPERPSPFPSVWALDVALRATNVTWDIVWRQDWVAWPLTVASIGGLAVSAIGSLRAGGGTGRE